MSERIYDTKNPGGITRRQLLGGLLASVGVGVVGACGGFRGVENEPGEEAESSDLTVVVNIVDPETLAEGVREILQDGSVVTSGVPPLLMDVCKYPAIAFHLSSETIPHNNHISMLKSRWIQIGYVEANGEKFVRTSDVRTSAIMDNDGEISNPTRESKLLDEQEVGGLPVGIEMTYQFSKSPEQTHRFIFKDCPNPSSSTSA
jgi:hypothetical protein